MTKKGPVEICTTTVRRLINLISCFSFFDLRRSTYLHVIRISVRVKHVGNETKDTKPREFKFFV